MPKLTNKISILAFALFMMFAITSNATAGGTLYVDDNAAAGGDGASWDTAYRFLYDAIIEAWDGGIIEIHVAQGIYKPDRTEGFPNGSGSRGASFYLINGVALKGGYAGIVAKDPNARDIELFESILSGDLLGDDEEDFVNNDENSYNVTTAIVTDETALLEGFTITAGYSDSFLGSNFGGGLFARESDARIDQCTFKENSARARGGGIYSEDGSISITNCNIIDNKVTGNAGDGGGIALGFGSFGAPTVDNCIFTGNIATNTGGGLFCIGPFPDGTMISNCTFENNIATSTFNFARAGGGMSVFFSTDGVQIVNCTFTNNTANHETGYTWGGALVVSQSDCRVVNCDFVGNNSVGNIEGRGGAIGVFLGNPQFVNCLVAGNLADVGGGIYNSNVSPSYVDCTITGNTAAVDGGAVHNVDSSETLLTNCNIWDNGLDPIIDEEDAVTTVHYSNVQGGWAGAGSNNIDADPLFVDPGNGDYRLSSGSPCIDAADNTAVSKGIFTDLDSNPRFVDDLGTPNTGNTDCINPIVDMGAYEFLPFPSPPADLDGDGFVNTIDLLILFANWGDCPALPDQCSADLNYNCIVDTEDLLALLASWG